MIMTASVGAYLVSGLALVALAPVIVPWYLGPAFTAAVPVAQLLGVAVAITGITSTLSLNLVAAGRSAVCSRVTISAAVAHLGLAAIGAYRYGALGAATALIITESVIAVTLALLSRRGDTKPPRLVDPVDEMANPLKEVSVVTQP